MDRLQYTPPALHLGWDMQFTRIESFVKPRIVRALQALAQECVERGYSVQLHRFIAEDAVSFSLVVYEMPGTIAAVLDFKLCDTWTQSSRPGAILGVQLHRGKRETQLPMQLKRFSDVAATDPGEVYYNAGDHVDVEALRYYLVGCL